MQKALTTKNYCSFMLNVQDYIYNLEKHKKGLNVSLLGVLLKLLSH